MKFKKPKFWDLKNPNIFAYLVSPFTVVLKFSNYFSKKSKKELSKKIKSICIGNIYLGGTGKTPTTIKIYELLKNTNLKIRTAKKFYLDQKDEQIILYNKTKLITHKTRKEIFKKAIDEKCDLIIFDDGLQDTTVDYDIKFVCFDTQNWIGNGCLIPSGPLREKLDSLKKYDGVFLKSNNPDYDSDEISTIIKKFNPNIKIFNSYVKINNLEKFDLSKKYLMFSGIGNSNSFKDILLRNKFNIIDEVSFPDHNNYNNRDIENLIMKAKKFDAKVITTEKDFVKISNSHKKDVDFLEIDLNIQKEDLLTKFINLKIYEKY